MEQNYVTVTLCIPRCLEYGNRGNQVSAVANGPARRNQFVDSL